jgi:hypothetical protein
VQFIRGRENSQNLGDAIREIYFLDLIKSDFILVFNNVITNMDIDKAY